MDDDELFGRVIHKIAFQIVASSENKEAILPQDTKGNKKTNYHYLLVIISLNHYAYVFALCSYFGMPQHPRKQDVILRQRTMIDDNGVRYIFSQPDHT